MQFKLTKGTTPAACSHATRQHQLQLAGQADSHEDKQRPHAATSLPPVSQG